MGALISDRQVEVAEYGKYLKQERMSKVFRIKDGKHKSIQQYDKTPINQGLTDELQTFYKA